MTGRPHVLLSCAMSIDGCIDDAGPSRLVLSSDADLDRVDAERARCDAIMVGANTVRRDDPRLLLRSAARRAARLARGLPDDPLRVTITASGDLDPARRLFTAGGAPPLVYCAGAAAARLRERLDGLAVVVETGDPADLGAVLDDLGGRGVRRLMVEGGTTLITELLQAGLVDELQLAVAPFLVGDDRAPRLVRGGPPRHGPADPLRLAGVERLGDLVLLRYLAVG